VSTKLKIKIFLQSTNQKMNVL